MQKSKLTRRALALRLFAAAIVINVILMLIFWPSAVPEIKTYPVTEGIEMKVRASLHTAFSVGKKVLLTQQNGTPVGTAKLLRQEEDGIVLALSEKMYRQHHRALIHEEWALIPYLDGIESRPRSKGTYYEIAY
jgi:hypothetical protein